MFVTFRGCVGMLVPVWLSYSTTKGNAMFLNLSPEESERVAAVCGGSFAGLCPSNLLADESHPDQSRFDRAARSGLVAR